MTDARTRRTIRRCTAVLCLVASTGLALGLPLLADVAVTPEYVSMGANSGSHFWIPALLAGACLLYLATSFLAQISDSSGESDDAGTDPA